MSLVGAFLAVVFFQGLPYTLVSINDVYRKLKLSVCLASTYTQQQMVCIQFHPDTKAAGNTDISSKDNEAQKFKLPRITHIVADKLRFPDLENSCFYWLISLHVTMILGKCLKLGYHLLDRSKYHVLIFKHWTLTSQLLYCFNFGYVYFSF